MSVVMAIVALVGILALIILARNLKR